MNCSFDSMLTFRNCLWRKNLPMVFWLLEFRKLLRQHSVKLCFTPMIIADSFNQSESARRNEFTTNQDDQPLIAQFAAKSAAEFVNAAQLIYPYVDGVDVNCGCPQSWAIAKGYGCGLLKDPQRMHDIVRTIRRTLPQDFSCSLKIRLLGEDVRSTVELARRLEHCGATFLTIHGRTQWQKCSHLLNVEAMAEIKSSVQIPVIVNGNVRTLADAFDIQLATKADGVMAARGLLSNPALFDARYSTECDTPLSCVKSWLDIASAAADNITFQCFHHHLIFMWSRRLKRNLRMQLNSFSRKDQVFKLFNDLYDIKPSTNEVDFIPYSNCSYTHFKTAQPHKYKVNDSQIALKKNKKTWQEGSNGKYFLEFKQHDFDNNSYAYDLEQSFFHNL